MPTRTDQVILLLEEAMCLIQRRRHHVRFLWSLLHAGGGALIMGLLHHIRAHGTTMTGHTNRRLLASDRWQAFVRLTFHPSTLTITHLTLIVLILPEGAIFVNLPLDVTLMAWLESIHLSQWRLIGQSKGSKSIVVPLLQRNHGRGLEHRAGQFAIVTVSHREELLEILGMF